MRSKHQLAEAVQAYIIPSGDAHQVITNHTHFNNVLLFL